MDQNEALLQAVVRGTEMGKNTLRQLLPMTGEPALRAELLRQQREYRRLNQKAHTALAALGTQADGLGVRARTVTRMGVAARARRDPSPEHLARMVVEGSAMGLSDCLGARNDCPCASRGAKKLADRLCQLEREGARNLRTFL